MKTIKEAADSLFKKGSITKEERDEIEKVAAMPDVLGTVKGGSTKGTLGLLGKVKPIATYVGGGILAASLLQQLLKPLAEKVKANISYNQLIDKNPVLAEKDPQLIKDYFGVINTFSPKAASNPLVAGALVNKMMEFGGVDHKLVQDIAAIQAGIESRDIIRDVAGAASKALIAGGGEVSTEYGPDFIPG